MTNGGKIRTALAMAACLLGAGGCAFIPPALEHGYAVLSGLSYLATSKGPADHVISMAMAQDCAPLRALLGKPACRPVSENSNRPLVATLIGTIDTQPADLPVEDLLVEFGPPVDLRMPPDDALAQTY